MIVMKFGGSSTASADAIRQVASIVQHEIQRKPVVVVSAMGNTTDRLLRLLQETALGHVAESLQLQTELRDDHLRIAGEVLSGVDSDWAFADVQRIFRDLHVRMLEILEGERAFNAELKDWVLSIGEQVSSLILAAAFNSLSIRAAHMDSRRLIVTDDRFTEAKPKFWETNAKLRWAIPESRPAGAVVVGGFIASTQDGRTTTLGRGGSDLTASIIGAALNAKEIQVWKDVDGMLTCDPRLHPGGFCVKHLTFVEAANLAQSGAKILHPDTVAPARRLRIPIYLRNTFRPHVEGTRICGESAQCAQPVVKSVACKRGLQLLRIRPESSEIPREQIYRDVEESLQRQRVNATFLGQTDKDFILAIEGSTDFAQLVFGFEGCLQVHLQSKQTLVTLVGDGIAGSLEIESKFKRAMEGLAGASVLPGEQRSCVLRAVVADKDTLRFLARVHASLFANADPALFEAPSDPVKALENVPCAVTESDRPAVWAGHRVLALAEGS